MENATDDLIGIPGIGPARKAALAAAGITTRAALAQMSVEQLISLTGMPHGQAHTALEAVRKDLPADAPTPAPPTDDALPVAPSQTDSPTDEEMLPLEAVETPAPDAPVLPDDDQDPATAARAILDRAVLRAKTALSDATRAWDIPKLNRPLTRLALTLDTITGEFTESLRPKPAGRLAARFEALATWLEESSARGTPQKDKQRERLQERIRTDRTNIEEAIKSASRRRANKTVKPGKKKK